MSDDLTPEDFHRAIDRAVEELLESAGVTRPPVDAVDLARRRFGMTVRVGARPGRRADGQEVVVPPDAGETARQLAAARAVGGRLRPDLLRRLGAAPGAEAKRLGVSLPNHFAERLLTPTAWFAADAGACGWDLLELKRKYHTAGWELIAWRLLDLPTPCVVTVVDDDKVRRRRSNAWRVKKTLEPAERECLAAVRGDGRPHVVRGGGWTVEGWPAPRPAGERVLLRSVRDDDG
jgi:hypothetical protein